MPCQARQVPAHERFAAGTRDRLCVVHLLTILLAAAPASAARQLPERDADVEVRVYATPAISLALRTQMRDTTERILDAAGIVTRWHDCTTPTPEPSCAPPPGRNVVIVRFADAFRRGACGEAVRSHLPGGLVSIDIGCVSAVGHAIRSIPDAPMLMRVRNGDILGVVLAHEVGHVFGQTHTKGGIMRRSYTRAEWDLFAAGRLTFSTNQARGLLAAVTPIHERDAGRQ